MAIDRTAGTIKMTEETKQAIQDLLTEIDNLTNCDRNVSMQSFKNIPQVSKLRKIIDKKTWYQVIVGNIGEVYDGDNKAEARESYREYYAQSREGYGRAAGESVTLMVDNEPIESVEQVCLMLA